MNQDVRDRFRGSYLEFLGFKPTVWKEGFVRIELPVRADLRNTMGYLHGGVIASLLDIAGALAGNFGRTDDYVSVTINMSTNYLSPMRGAVACAEGELVRRTRSMFFAQMKLYDAENKRLCATAMGNYKPQRRGND